MSIGGDMTPYYPPPRQWKDFQTIFLRRVKLNKITLLHFFASAVGYNHLQATV